jgi:phenylalanyl-tRNA synthetase beta chain
MRASYRFLRELLPELDATPTEIGERLTAAGLEVEGLREFGAGTERVVAAAVRAVEPHPSRDRLRLVTVDVGGGRELRVVCGASNVPAPGTGLVAFAPIGTHLPAAGLTLEPRAIGGVDSAGMLCSEEELGLAEASEGIVVLPTDAARPGTPLADVVGTARDTIFEIGVTPNRPDALGHVGLARELGALFRVPFRMPGAEAAATKSSPALDALVEVTVEEPERCPIYGAAVVEGVTVRPSPAWLRYRLYALGIRPISNVVDVTNLILLEYGQPMHAFDHSLVAGGRIIVRRAKPGEPFTTLDGVERKLDPDDLVIADPRGPSALAGIMGGATSEIREATRRVLLEVAYFRPQGVRRTGRRHGLSTESSFRFERGVDFGAIPAVVERAKTLMVELSGGRAVPGAILAGSGGPSVPDMRLRSRRLDALLGTPVPFEEATSILGRLGFVVRKTEDTSEGPVAHVTGASFRPDVSREIDLLEEVARVRGFDRIPTVLPAISPQEPRVTGRIERAVSQEAQHLGLSEAVTYSFVSEKELAALGAPPAVVKLKNPMSEERSVMRTSLLPGLFEVLRHARRHGEQKARLFGVGAVFLSPKGATSSPARPLANEDAGVLPEERPSFAAVLAGPRPSYLSKPEDVDVYDAKGVATELVDRVTGRAAQVSPMTPEERPKYLHPRGAAWVTADGRRVGCFGPVHPDVADALDLGGPAQVVELDLAAIEALGKPVPSYRPIPRLPAVSRDVAVVVGDDVPSVEVEGEIRRAAGELCESVELFDLFRGGSIPEGFRSLAYHVVYRDPKAATSPDAARTLTDDEVDRHHERVRAAVKRFGELRS